MYNVNSNKGKRNSSIFFKKVQKKNISKKKKVRYNAWKELIKNSSSSVLEFVFGQNSLVCVPKDKVCNDEWTLITEAYSPF